MRKYQEIIEMEVRLIETVYAAYMALSDNL
jgi:hypothetical protein